MENRGFISTLLSVMFLLIIILPQTMAFADDRNYFDGRCKHLMISKVPQPLPASLLCPPHPLWLSDTLSITFASLFHCRTVRWNWSISGWWVRHPGLSPSVASVYWVLREDDAGVSCLADRWRAWLWRQQQEGAQWHPGCSRAGGSACQRDTQVSSGCL